MTNESPITAKQVRLIIESWSFTAVGLNSDTKLAIKDETVNQIDIPAGDTKQFNLFVSVFTLNTSVVCVNQVCGAPNWPAISGKSLTMSMTLRLVGDNVDVIRYKVLATIDASLNINVTAVNLIE